MWVKVLKEIDQSVLESVEARASLVEVGGECLNVIRYSIDELIIARDNIPQESAVTDAIWSRRTLPY